MAIKNKLLPALTALLSTPFVSAHGPELYHEFIENPVRGLIAVIIVAVIIIAIKLISDRK